MRRDTQKRIRVVAAGVFGGFVWALMSCRDVTQPAALVERPPRISGSVQRIAVDSGWNYYSADMEMITQGDAGFGVAEARSTFHVERTLDVNDIWTTSTLIDPEGTFGPIPSGAVNNTLVARVLSRDDGSTPTLYDRSGAIVSFQFPDTTDLPRIPSAYRPGADTLRPWPTATGSGPPAPSVGVPSGAPPSSALVVSGARPKGDPRTWLDGMVITPAARLRNMGRLQRRFGMARERVGDLDRYAESSGKESREVLVDPVIGAAVEERASVNGVLRVRRTHTFARLEGGGFVRAATRFEVPQAGRRGTMVMTSSVSNVRVERRGIRP